MNSTASLGLTAIFLLSACVEESLVPPTARKIPHQLETHGDIRTDDYFWLNERGDPDVLAYLEEENAYSGKVMAHTAGLQDVLFQELKSRTDPEEESVPYKYGNYFYYHRYETDREYPIFCRKKGSVDAPEEIVLDLAKEFSQFDSVILGATAISPNNRYYAFGLDTDGSDSYTI